MNKSWKSYQSGDFFYELITPKGSPRAKARRLVNLLQMSLANCQFKRQLVIQIIRDSAFPSGTC